MSDRDEIMQDRPFWTRLEYRASDWLASAADRNLRWHWIDGFIPDVVEAVESPQRLSEDRGCVDRLLELVPQVPTPVWGRDELRAGEMWNSNSVISWLVACCGLDSDSIQPPVARILPVETSPLVAVMNISPPLVPPKP